MFDDNRRVLPNTPFGPSPKAEDPGPKRPDVERPNTDKRDELLKRMRRVDPEQARKYRQRSGQ